MVVHSNDSGESSQQELIARLKQAQDQLMQSEKMASIGQLAAGVAHEINNPIGYVRSNLTTLGEYCRSLLAVNQAYEQALGEALNSPELKRVVEEHDLPFLREDLPSLLEESHEGIERVSKIIRSLRDFSRTDSGQFEPVDVQRAITQALTVAHNEIKYRAEVVTEFADLPPIEAVESQLGQVFLNLFVNAAQAIEEHGEIRVRTELMGDRVQVTVSDNGCGVAPENLKRLFDPFFTTKPVGKGTGLGLSLSYNIIRSHNGTMKVASEPGKGTTFTLELPLQQPQPQPEPEGPQ
ncbi:MAG: ATP-binding protein [Oleiphilaceae bacterium]|nr:ATP-binding protein [Oleiphilaceae bacterium]